MRTFDLVITGTVLLGFGCLLLAVYFATRDSRPHDHKPSKKRPVGWDRFS